MSEQYARSQYAGQRRKDIMEAVNELSFDSKTEWLGAAIRLQGKINHLRLDDALEILVTLFATNDQLPLQELPD